MSTRTGARLILAVAVGFTLVGAAATFAEVNHKSTHTGCVVTGKDRTTDSSGTSQMRVYTENCGVFTVEDSILLGRLNSADLYARIQPGKTYTINTVGWRMPVFSTFPNISEAVEEK